MPRNGKIARGRVYQRKTLEERFWPRVNKAGPVVRPELGPCWLWTGATLRNGYGCLRHDGKTITAHAAAWVVAGEVLPQRGLELCHKCDVRRCARPEHLFVGTRADNMQDALAKGRLQIPRASGSRHPQSKLTEAQVVELRRLAAAGTSKKELGRRFGISDTMAGLIVNGRNWKHVEGACGSKG